MAVWVTLCGTNAPSGSVSFQVGICVIPAHSPVIPVKTGIQNIRMQALSHIVGYLKALDSCFRRNDGEGRGMTG